MTNETDVAKITCTKCKVEKLASSFHKNSRSPTGLQYECIDCRKEIKKRSQQSNKYITSHPRKPNPGFSLQDCFPDLANFYSSSNPYSPMEISKSSGFNAIWDCPKCNMQFSYPVRFMTSQNPDQKLLNCPHCLKNKKKNQKLINTHPWLKSWFSPNNKDEVQTINLAAKKIFNWTCSSGHDFAARPSSAVAGCPICKTRKNSVAVKSPSLLEEWDDNRDPLTITSGSSYVVKWKCKRNPAHKWEASVYSRTSKKNPSNCPYCFSASSKGESEVAEFVKSLGVNIELRNRKVIKPYELDIYALEEKIAIEYNGLYWHDYDHVGDDSHQNKWEMCQRVGIDLITVWEDDWQTKQNLVKHIIQEKLGFPNSAIVDPNKVHIKEVSLNVSKKFFNKYGIPKECESSFAMAAYAEGKVIGMSSWSWQENLLVLDRHAFRSPAPVILEKMLVFARQYSNIEIQEIVALGNNDYSEGRALEKVGFVKDIVIKSDYKVVLNKTRVSKKDINYYEKNKPLPRIYDCGTTRYVMKIQTNQPTL